MSVSAYLVGVVALGFVAVPLWLTARLLRARCFPGWLGALARLAEAVVFLSLLVLIAQFLGAVGEFRRVPLVASSVLVALVVRIASHRCRPRDDQRQTSAARETATSDVLVVALVVLIATPWFAGAVRSFENGVGGYDSLNYHLPFAARFVRSGRITPLPFVFPGFDTPFYPANGELFHAIGMAMFRRDLLSPFVNLAWLGLALLAAWCVGIPRHVSVATLATVGVLVTTPLFVSTNAGRGVNDITSIALLLACVALLINAQDRPAAIGLAAAACGLALATKLTMVVPVAALTFVVIVSARRARRAITTVTWLACLILTGSFWYVRNTVLIGNPIPTLHIGVGWLSLPSPRINRPYPAYSVSHYLLDVRVWRSAYLPGLRSAFGIAWPIVLGLAAIGVAIALWNDESTCRLLGIVGLASLVAYIFTPNTAVGTATGTAGLFTRNVRYAYPGLTIGLLLAPLVLATPHRARLRKVSHFVVGLALLASTYYTSMTSTALLLRAVGIEAALLLVGSAVVLLRAWLRADRVIATVLAVVTSITIVCLGWFGAHVYLEHRYGTNSELPYASAPRAEVHLLYRWAASTSHSRIGVGALGFQYPLFGPDLSNDVQFIGQPGPHGAFDLATSCRQWRKLVNAGHYQYIVITADQPGTEPIEARWTRTDRAAQAVADRGTATIFRLNGVLDEHAC